MSRTDHKVKEEKRKGCKSTCKCWQRRKTRSYNRRKQELESKGDTE